MHSTGSRGGLLDPAGCGCSLPFLFCCPFPFLPLLDAVSPPSSFRGHVSTHRNRKEARCSTGGVRARKRGGRVLYERRGGRRTGAPLGPHRVVWRVVRRFLFRRYTSLLLSGHSVHYLFSSCFLLPLFSSISVTGRSRGDELERQKKRRGGEALYNNIDDFMNSHHPECEIADCVDTRVPNDV